ncbi:hypothetical protein QYF36_009993 [Acer negundo]|nr:hypothetical protein QYF36_009993 [Acer negundo]
MSGGDQASRRATDSNDGERNGFKRWAVRDDRPSSFVQIDWLLRLTRKWIGFSQIDLLLRASSCREGDDPLMALE